MIVSKYTREQHEEYLDMLNHIGMRWTAAFRGNIKFYSAAYFDLFTGMWNEGVPIKKTDALELIKALKSSHTVAKCVDAAVRKNLIIEAPNPDDHRSKLLRLSPEVERALDSFFDDEIDQMKRTIREIAKKKAVKPNPSLEMEQLPSQTAALVFTHVNAVK